MIYFPICVNFKILGKNGDNWAKEEYTKLKREGWNTPTLTKAAQTCKRVIAPPGELAQASHISLE